MLKKILNKFKTNKQQKQQQNNTELLFTKCSELPIHNFNEVANNNDFSYLKRNRNSIVSDDEIQSAWLNILDEFLKISNNAYAINILKKKSKVIHLGKKLQVLQIAKYAIDKGIDVTDILKQYKITEKSLNANIGLIKNDISRINSAVPDEEEEDLQDRNQDFENTIVLLLENGYHINRNETVVTTWVSALNRLDKKYKANKQ